MSQVMKYSILILLAFQMSGCICPRPKPATNSGVYKVPSSIPYQLKAMEYENNEQYAMAIVYWGIAAKLLQEKIRGISEKAGKDAEVRFINGVSFLEQKKTENARNQFLSALVYNPSHERSVYYLKNKLSPEKTVNCCVLKNDSFGAIAARVYKDENYSFVVKYFSGFDDNTQLIEGTELVLPVIGDEITGKIFHLNKELIKARSLYKNGEFEKLVIVAEKIFKHSSEEEASFLLNSAYCGFGEDLVKAGKLAEAIEVYSKVNPAFKNVDSKIENLKKLQLKKEKEAVAMAYSEYLSKGIALYENKNYFGALEMLNTVELDYLGIKELKEAIIRDMNAIGEQYYKEGVKLFIDEDLTGAIGQWKLALKYNPNHGKATKDIENAKGILEKINDIGKKP